MTNTVPTECGKCWKCGHALYLGLSHSCSTAVNLPAESDTVVVPKDDPVMLLVREAAEALERMNRELAEAKKDAERYRWFRQLCRDDKRSHGWADNPKIFDEDIDNAMLDEARKK